MEQPNMARRAHKLNSKSYLALTLNDRRHNQPFGKILYD